MEVNKVEISKNDRILTRKFFGSVTTDMLLTSWNDIILTGELLSDIDGVITDLSDAELIVDFVDLKSVATHYTQNQKHFQGLKLAQVMDTPKVALAEVLKTQIPGIQLEIFSTLEAARSWILD